MALYKSVFIAIIIIILRASEDRLSQMFSSKLCAAAPVVASSSLEEVRRWLGHLANTMMRVRRRCGLVSN